MDSLSISSELNEEDWIAYRRAAAIATSRVTNAKKWVAFALLAFIVGVTLALLLYRWGHGLTVPSFLIGAIGSVALLAMSYRIRYAAILSKQRDAFVGRWEYTFDAAGVRVIRTNRDAFVAWPVISEAVRDGNHLFVWIDNFTAFTIPVRDLPAGVTSEEFIARINSWRASPTEAFETRVQTSDAPSVNISSPHQVSKPSQLQGQIAALIRLLTLRKADSASIVGGDGLIAALLGFSLALWTLIDMLQSGQNADFYVYNAATFALILLVLMFISWILARRTYPRTDFRRVLLVVTAFVPVAILAIVGILAIDRPYVMVAAAVVLCVYAILYLLRSLTVLTGTRQIRPVVFVVVIATVTIWAFADSVYFDTSIWYGPDDNVETTDAPAELGKQKEELLYEQRDLIDEALDAIHRPTNAPAAVFFVGFAGVGEQHVFAEEIKLASKVVGKRYDVGDRSLLLMNDRRDLETYPLASTTALRYALQGLAEKMDVEHDILFLALSSHGSSKPLLSVSNVSLPLNDMSASDLASALRESGIKWRVIVISACYAGAFMGHLRDPYTIVIAAAAPDKTSFGCSDDRDLTYFGEAFYRDALPQSTSLGEAFAIAKASIEKREKAENVTPSDPRAFFGDKIEQKLIELKFDATRKSKP